MRFWHCKKPTIAAVQGYCLAGGCELALACDITIAAEDAVFGEPELKFGAGIVVMILPWLVGPKRAKEIILTGADRIPAAEAARIGLVNRVVPPDQVEIDRARARPPHRGDRSALWCSRPSGRSTSRSRSWVSFARSRLRSTSISRSRAKAAKTSAGSWRSRARTDCAAAIAWRDARFAGSADG